MENNKLRRMCKSCGKMFTPNSKYQKLCKHCFDESQSNRVNGMKEQKKLLRLERGNKNLIKKLSRLQSRVYNVQLELQDLISDLETKRAGDKLIWKLKV